MIRKPARGLVLAAVLVWVTFSATAAWAQHHGGHHGSGHAAYYGGGGHHYAPSYSFSYGHHYTPQYYGGFYGDGSGNGYYSSPQIVVGHFRPSYYDSAYYGHHYTPSYGYDYGHGYSVGHHYSGWHHGGR